jgi:hypothetical protein
MEIADILLERFMPQPDNLSRAKPERNLKKLEMRKSCPFGRNRSRAYPTQDNEGCMYAGIGL